MGHGASARPGPTPAAAPSLPEPHPTSSGPSPGSPDWPLQTQAAQTDPDPGRGGQQAWGTEPGTGARLGAGRRRQSRRQPFPGPPVRWAPRCTLRPTPRLPPALRAHFTCADTEAQDVKSFDSRLAGGSAELTSASGRRRPSERTGRLGVCTTPAPACQPHPVRPPKGLARTVSDKVTTSLPHCSTVRPAKQAQRRRASRGRKGHAPCLDAWPLSALGGHSGQLLLLPRVPTRLCAVPWAQEGTWPIGPSLP